MKTLTGTIVSLKTAKTAVVAVSRLVVHPIYKKGIRRIKKIKAHHESEKLNVGDKVEIIPTRPISKDKHFRVIERNTATKTV